MSYGVSVQGVSFQGISDWGVCVLGVSVQGVHVRGGFCPVTNRVTSEIIYTNSQHSDLMFCVSDSFVGPIFNFIKSRKRI